MKCRVYECLCVGRIEGEPRVKEKEKMLKMQPPCIEVHAGSRATWACWTPFASTVILRRACPSKGLDVNRYKAVCGPVQTV